MARGKADHQQNDVGCIGAWPHHSSRQNFIADNVQLNSQLSGLLH
jgi:hypothetical protein